MNRKIFTLAVTAVLSVFLLAGCGNASTEADSNSLADGSTFVSGAVDESGAADTVPECAHEWVEATFAEPKTCALCGKTEGEPRQSYFEEHGVQVADTPVACTVNAVNFDYFDITNQRITDAVWKQTDCYSEPADEEGYHIVHLELEESHQLFYDAATYIEYNFCSLEYDVYDWYTGRVFPKRQLYQDDEFDYSTMLEIDGVQYNVFYSISVEWEHDDWKNDSNGNGTKTSVGHHIYTFKVPDGYDGLVFGAVPENEYTGLDTETVDEDERYALDEGYIEGTVFFRINKEGTVPEKL